jgi:hypothetical protein
MSEQRKKEIQDLMTMKGYTIKNSDLNTEEVAFEYESDSIEIYKMISNEFDYDEIKETETFVIKQYKDSIYRG